MTLNNNIAQLGSSTRKFEMPEWQKESREACIEAPATAIWRYQYFNRANVMSICTTVSSVKMIVYHHCCCCYHQCGERGSLLIPIFLRWEDMREEINEISFI